MSTRRKYWLHTSSTSQATAQVSTAVSPQTARNFGLEPVTHRCDDRSGYRAVTKLLLANTCLMCVCCRCQQIAWSGRDSLPHPLTDTEVHDAQKASRTRGHGGRGGHAACRLRKWFERHQQQ